MKSEKEPCKELEKKRPDSPLWVEAQTCWDPSLLVRGTERQVLSQDGGEEGGGKARGGERGQAARVSSASPPLQGLMIE